MLIAKFQQFSVGHIVQQLTYFSNYTDNTLEKLESCTFSIHPLCPLTFLMAPSSRSTAALLDFHSPSLGRCSLVLLSIPPPSSCPSLPITPLSSLFAPNFTITFPTPDARTLFLFDFWQVSEMTISTRTSVPCPSPSATTIGQCCS